PDRFVPFTSRRLSANFEFSGSSHLAPLWRPTGLPSPGGSFEISGNEHYAHAPKDKKDRGPIPFWSLHTTNKVPASAADCAAAHGTADGRGSDAAADLSQRPAADQCASVHGVLGPGVAGRHEFRRRQADE